MTGGHVRTLREVIPFRFVRGEALALLAERCRSVDFAAGAFLMEQGDESDRTTFVLLEGLVEVVDGPGDRAVRVSTIEPFHYFGEWEAVFGGPRVYGIRAVGDCRCLAIAADDLNELITGDVAFAQALANILRERQGIFRGFELFDAELTRGIGYGHISIQKLVPLYQALAPALHPHANDPERLDVGALDYAVRRLPHNISATFAFLIRDELPSVYQRPDEFFPAILTDARRRAVWEILPGKNLFLTRTGESDITDFITCLCVYAVEARKIRRRIYDVKGVGPIRDFLDAPGGGDPAALWAALGFDRAEADGLTRIWGGQAARRLWEIVNHREMFSIDVRTKQSAYNLKDFARWSKQISQATAELTGRDPGDLPDEVDVHIVSSNTHSVTNCLNPWYADNAAAIAAWAEETGHPVYRERWETPTDCLYAIARDYFKAHPGSEAAMLAAERANGSIRLGATASTGIEVEVIDLDSIRGKAIDPLLPVWRGGRRTLVVNIDYAFGEQAEHIIHQLILLYGRNLRSVNFLGKAGSLVGRRGDILVPGAFIEQAQDQFMPVAPPGAAERASLAELAGGRGVHYGPMLTVKGTLLQNRLMLTFYRKLWKVTGIEMEGIHYHRQVVESIQTGVLRPDLASRFYYYVSDLPLDASSNLSERLKASEGVPPLYAITRQILRGILA